MAHEHTHETLGTEAGRYDELVELMGLLAAGAVGSYGFDDGITEDTICAEFFKNKSVDRAVGIGREALAGDKILDEGVVILSGLLLVLGDDVEGRAEERNDVREILDECGSHTRVGWHLRLG